MNILFLDIDGTMNNMDFNKGAQSFTILPNCVNQLNRIIYDGNAGLVLISSWRYLVLGGAMKLEGMEWLLRSHGIWCPNRLVGTTNFDIKNVYERPMQVAQWLQNNKNVKNHVVLDDNPKQDWVKYGLKNVLVNKNEGLTEQNANKAILILRGMV